MPWKPRPTEKLYWSISEVAELLGVNASIVRYWENEFDIIQPHKNKKGNRLFTKTDIENLQQIHYLVKTKGYTLSGAKDQLKHQRIAVATKADAVNSLNNIKAYLLELKKLLDQ
ncbi:MAG: MerR family transcriptional regulator [Luteibaculum sp.]